MGLFRGHLSWVIAPLLACQLWTVGSPLALLCCGDTTPRTPAPSHSASCCKGMGPGQMCPMRHAPTREDKGTCRMRGGCRTGDLAVLALMTGLGFPASTSARLAFRPTSEAVTSIAVADVRRSDPPESPPPRT